MKTQTDIWSEIHEQRWELFRLLQSLTPEQWDGATLCEGWRVRDVVGHLIIETKINPFIAIPQIALAGFNMNRYLFKDGRRHGRAPIADLLESFEASIPTCTTPPRQPPVAMLEDIVIHHIDIARPLGILGTSPPTRFLPIANKVVGDTFFPGPRLAKGLRLVATDIEWTAGTGPEVRGPIEALVLTLSGRYASIDELDGDGLATLKSRTSLRGERSIT